MSVVSFAGAFAFITVVSLTLGDWGTWKIYTDWRAYLLVAAGAFVYWSGGKR